MPKTKNNIPRAILLVVVLVALGGFFGRLAGPALSRTHYLVQVAERLHLEESQGLEEETLQTTAFRNLGLPAEQLYADARDVREKFVLAATLFGIWCGLVAALKMHAILAEGRRDIFEPDPAHCVACSRCYLSCPIERTRLKKLKRRPAT